MSWRRLNIYSLYTRRNYSSVLTIFECFDLLNANLFNFIFERARSFSFCNGHASIGKSLNNENLYENLKGTMAKSTDTVAIPDRVIPAADFTKS